jgi:hypothetical protein
MNTKGFEIRKTGHTPRFDDREDILLRQALRKMIMRMISTYTLAWIS